MIFIIVWAAMAALLLAAFAHEEDVVRFERRVADAIRRRIDERRAERLRAHGYSVVRIPADCTQIVTLRFRR